MDIQEKKAFEIAFDKKLGARGCQFDLDEDGNYEDRETLCGWHMWLEAKAQAVPEWAVIVPRLSANYLFNKIPELGFAHQDEKDTVLYHLNYMASEFKDSAKVFVLKDHAKQKKMIEAQEQGHV